MKMFTLMLVIAAGMYGLTTNKEAEIIQIDVSTILNARPVTVLNNGKLVTWTKGIDGNGKGDGYLTMAAALFNGDKNPHALPDNPLFATNGTHPAIALHYSNDDTVTSQARFISGEGSFEFKVPAHRYSGMYICLTSAEGPSQLQFQLVYAHNTETRDFLLPDYYSDLTPNNSNITYLAHDLAKWNDKNKMAEADHHNIDVVNIHPDASRVLTAIRITKGKAGYLIFWAATGVVAK